MNRIAKIAIIVQMVNLTAFYSYFGFYIPLCNQICAVVYVMYLLSVNKSADILPKEVKYWLAFCCTALIGAVLNSHMDHSLTSIYEYLTRIALCMVIIGIVEEDGDASYPVFVCGLVAISCSIVVLARPGSIADMLTTSQRLSDNMNQNNLGYILNMGLLSLLIFFDLRKKNYLINIGLQAMVVLVTVLTGSRKALLAAVFIYAVWCVFRLPALLREAPALRKAFFFCMLIGIVIVSVNVLWPYFTTSRVYLRLLGNATTQSSDEGRIELYIKGLQMWWDKPIFGYGFMTAKYYAGGIPLHSIYADTLATTGTVGMILQFVPYYMMFKRLKNTYRVQKYFGQDTHMVFMMRLSFAVFMLIGLGNCLYNRAYGMLHLATILSYSIVAERQALTDYYVSAGRK